MKKLIKRLKIFPLLFQFSIIFFSSSLIANAQIQENPFTDIDLNPYKSSILHFYEDGVLQGYEDNTFKPEQKVQRDEFVKMAIMSANLTPEEETDCFEDEKNQWSENIVCSAHKWGLVHGYDDGLFHPERNITLVEAAKIIVETNRYKNYLLTPNLTGSIIPSTPWYKVYIDELEEKNGIPLSLTRFDEEINRGETAEMMYREKIFNTLYKNGRTYEELSNLHNFNEIISNDFNKYYSPNSPLKEYPDNIDYKTFFGYGNKIIFFDKNNVYHFNYKEGELKIIEEADRETFTIQGDIITTVYWDKNYFFEYNEELGRYAPSTISKPENLTQYFEYIFKDDQNIYVYDFNDGFRKLENIDAESFRPYKKLSKNSFYLDNNNVYYYEEYDHLTTIPELDPETFEILSNKKDLIADQNGSYYFFYKSSDKYDLVKINDLDKDSLEILDKYYYFDTSLIDFGLRPRLRFKDNNNLYFVKLSDNNYDIPPEILYFDNIDVATYTEIPSHVLNDEFDDDHVVYFTKDKNNVYKLDLIDGWVLIENADPETFQSYHLWLVDRFFDNAFVYLNDADNFWIYDKYQDEIIPYNDVDIESFEILDEITVSYYQEEYTEQTIYNYAYADVCELIQADWDDYKVNGNEELIMHEDGTCDIISKETHPAGHISTAGIMGKDNNSVYSYLDYHNELRKEDIVSDPATFTKIPEVPVFKDKDNVYSMKLDGLEIVENADAESFELIIDEEKQEAYFKDKNNTWELSEIIDMEE